ncbi:hypothetical protein PTI98_004192 [Pleurotus ostreatus]|nr:hypothetical protein PTI98_009119 [Pleurotus ostreatus]KAJ8697382.1 hypothetical protein PTI98_004192 [Pleurotus ostreatus]
MNFLCSLAFISAFIHAIKKWMCIWLLEMLQFSTPARSLFSPFSFSHIQIPESVLFVTTSGEVAIDVVLEHHITLSGHLFKAKVMIGERYPNQYILMLGINDYGGPLYAIELERAKDHLAFDNESCSVTMRCSLARVQASVGSIQMSTVMKFRLSFTESAAFFAFRYLVFACQLPHNEACSVKEVELLYDFFSTCERKSFEYPHSIKGILSLPHIITLAVIVVLIYTLFKF